MHGEVQTFAALSRQRPTDRQQCADEQGYVQAPIDIGGRFVFGGRGRRFR